MKVSLVSTVLNEADNIERFLNAIESQTLLPDEVIIVDGGSTDGTLRTLESWASGRAQMRIISAPGTNISQGRNIGIAAAANPVIAVTDAGAYPKPEWLARLLSSFEDPDADVAMGFYEPDPKNLFESVQGCLNLPDAQDVDPLRFMPSSRSIAFTKKVWEEAGGYPEWLDIGEDMYFNFRVLEQGATRTFEPRAIVKWQLRATLPDFFCQYYRYARGDAVAGMYWRRHAIRFTAYIMGACIIVLAVKWPPLSALVVAAGLAWLRPAFRRAMKRIGKGRATAFVMIPILAAMMDIAKMAGFLSGIGRRSRSKRGR